MYRFLLKIFLVMVLFAPSYSFAQDSVQDEPQSAAISLSSDESSILIGAGDDSSQPSSGSSVVPTILAFVKMLVVLLIVLACAYGVFFLMKRSSGASASSDPFLRKVSQVSLGAGKSVQIVTLLDNAYILGVTDNSVNMIAQISDKDIVDSMNVYADKNDRTSRPRTFADVLDIFMAKGPNSGNVFGSADSAASVLRKQRERFNDGNGEGR